MVIPTTGLVFSFGALIYFLLSQKFWRYYEIEGNDIAKIFSFSFLTLGLGYLIESMPCLFLIDSQAVWHIIYPIFLFFISIGYSLMIYVIIWIKFRKYTKWFWFLFLMTSIYVIISFIIKPPVYFFTDGVLNWEVHQSATLSSGISLIFLLPTIIFFFNEAKSAKDKKAKLRSFGLGLSMSFLIIACLIDMYLLGPFKLHPVYSDLNWFVLFSVLAITLFITWGPPKPKYVTKIE